MRTAQLKNLGSGGSTLRFGGVWTTAMIVQVALTVICDSPAMGIPEESLRDRASGREFPAERIPGRADRAGSRDRGRRRVGAAFARGSSGPTRELERRIAQEPGVTAVTFGDRLPGMGVAVRRAEVEVAPADAPGRIANMWTAAVGPGYFEAFDMPMVAGRDFHDGDRAPSARTVLVNEAFARRYMNGASPVGAPGAYTSGDPATPQPWFEIVGIVRDMGMTPTDLGEAPYVFRARRRPRLTAGDGRPRRRRPGGVRAAPARHRADLDPGLRLDDVRPLDELAWRRNRRWSWPARSPTVVALGLFLSAAGIFSLMSVSVARRTSEIGLRAALGAARHACCAGIFSRAARCSSAAASSPASPCSSWSSMLRTRWIPGLHRRALLMTSAVMLTVGLLACVEPARRALRIHPTDALKEA